MGCSSSKQLDMISKPRELPSAGSMGEGKTAYKAPIVIKWTNEQKDIKPAPKYISE